MGRGLQLVAGLVLMAGSMVALPASAGTVYRCDDGNGVLSYSSSRIKGARCTAVTSYTASPEPPPASRRAPAGKQAGATTSKPYQAPRRVHGQVYSYIKDGVRHYTSERPRGVAGVSALRTIKYSYIETCYACAAKPGVSFATVALNMAAYQVEVAAAAKEFGVDEAIVRAIIHAESSFDPKALSRAGAQGLMQLMPATATRFGVSDAFNAKQNIRGGVKYLAWLLKRFKGNLTLAAAGYNAGEGAVDKYDGVPPYRETQRYVKRVNILAGRYREALASLDKKANADRGGPGEVLATR